MAFDFEGKPEGCDRATYRRITRLEGRLEGHSALPKIVFGAFCFAKTNYHADRVKSPLGRVSLDLAAIGSIAYVLWNIPRAKF